MKSSDEHLKPQLPATVDTLKRYGSATQFMLTFNKDIQPKTAQYPDRAYLGKAPSLNTVSKTYNPEVLNIWIVAQLEDVNNFTNIRHKMTLEQMEQTATLIATEYAYLKVTEVHLFLHRFKAGRYGTFYGCIDPLQITYALAQFAEQRRSEIVKIEQYQNTQQIIKQRQQWAETSISRQEYELLKTNNHETRK